MIKKKKVSKSARLLEQILANRSLRRAIVTESFEWFFTVYFHDYFEFEMAPFHDEMFRIAENDANKLAVVCAFRGSAKSTIFSTAYVIWSILGRQQKKFALLLGQTEPKARQNLINIKTALERNELLRRDLGPFEEEHNQWGSTALVIKKLNAKIGIGSVDQSIRGVRHEQHRPDLLVLDDIEDSSSVKTQEIRDKVYNWFTSEIIPLGSHRTRIIAVGNFLHEDSLLKRLEQEIKNGRPHSIYREYPIVNEKGEPMWPGKYPTIEAIEEERRKVMNPVTWHREYLLQSFDEENQPIKREWIKYYDILPPDNYHTEFVIGIDLALSLKETADYTAMVSAQIQGRGDEMRVYILPNVVNKRLTSLQTIETAKILYQSLPYGAKIYVEDNGYQASIVEHLEHQHCQVKGVRSIGDKLARLNAVNFLIQSGQVFFPKEGAEQLLTQLLGFGSERHDDLVDALSIVLTLAAKVSTGPRVMFGVGRPDAIGGVTSDHSDYVDSWNLMSSREKQNYLERNDPKEPEMVRTW